MSPDDYYLWVDMTAFVNTHIFIAVVVIAGYLGIAVGGKRHDIPSTQQQASFYCLTPEEEWHIGKSSLASTNQVRANQPLLPTLMMVSIILLTCSDYCVPQEGLIVMKKALDNRDVSEMGAYVGGILAKLCDVNDLLQGGDDNRHHHRDTRFHSIETPKVDIADYITRIAAQGIFPNICFILCLV